ncbi:putative tpr domain protein [Neofusicoccum parvum UCRNP2]|uniref:Putative tpr domain protein n=1 Tax=Botryosphaeria parva (strain UCR-NP2) TaxID=1287680 RepID=R1GD77_BOTPV|nr:putative tpr domain protein [Neofusicoccum parvum UCRNP2]
MGSAQDDYYDLGTFHRAVSTRSPEAQLWFTRGLIWSYAFNHEEAARCFGRTVSHDPGCAMGHWGLAYALGPNYNKPWELFDADDLSTTLAKTQAAVEQALAHAGSASPTEQALIRAIQHRRPRDAADTDYAACNRAYADAMADAYAAFPDDLDVATLHADALMNVTPWNLWDLRTGLPTAQSRAAEAKRVLERAMAADAANALVHPGLLHMYVHLIEMSSTPELGVVPADALRDLVPEAGHLRHMPSHLDILIGDYRRAVQANQVACAADEKYFAREGGANFYTVYRLHDYHSLIYAAMFNGQSKFALDTVAKMEAHIPEHVLRVQSPPMADWLEAGLSPRMHVLVRFGRWQDILDLELPADRQLYCVTTAMMHYAKGVAFAATGNVPEAEKQRALLHEAVDRVPASRMEYPNKCSDILAIAKAMLDGELEYRKENFEAAFEHLRKAVELDDALVYAEP